MVATIICSQSIVVLVMLSKVVLAQTNATVTREIDSGAANRFIAGDRSQLLWHCQISSSVCYSWLTN